MINVLIVSIWRYTNDIRTDIGLLLMWCGLIWIGWIGLKYVDVNVDWMEDESDDR